MKCADCAYYWKADDEKYWRCYFTEWRGEPSWLNVPPCEQDDEPETNDDEE